MPQYIAPSAFFNKLGLSFALKLDVNSNIIDMRYQMYLSTHNAICYKYGAAVTRQCRFDFFCSKNEQIKIII